MEGGYNIVESSFDFLLFFVIGLVNVLALPNDIIREEPSTELLPSIVPKSLTVFDFRKRSKSFTPKKLLPMPPISSRSFWDGRTATQTLHRAIFKLPD